MGVRSCVELLYCGIAFALFWLFVCNEVLESGKKRMAQSQLRKTKKSKKQLPIDDEASMDEVGQYAYMSLDCVKFQLIAF